MERLIVGLDKSVVLVTLRFLHVVIVLIETWLCKCISLSQN